MQRESDFVEIPTAAELCLIEQYLDDDISSTALALAGRTDVRPKLVLRQIEGRQRLRRKVPSWAACSGVLFPQRLSLEQCSGEAAAVYKRRLVERILPDAASMADLTGGLGVDFSFLAPLFKEATYVERQPELVGLARHNMPFLGINNVRFVEDDAEDVLAAMPPADLVFLDPARRDGAGRKVVLLSDCSPSIETLMPQLLRKARFVLLKLSPMLDLQAAMRSLPSVAEVHVVAEGGECKELLLLINADAPAEPRIFCADGTVTFSFTASEERDAVAPVAERVGRFLYEPDAALMKAGAFKLPAVRFGVQKLHANSHLYTSEEMIANFPGRIFAVDAVYDYSRAEMRRFIGEFHSSRERRKAHANVAVRNFPMQAAALRDKLHLTDGGDSYIFGTTLSPEQRVVVVCRKA